MRYRTARAASDCGVKRLAGCGGVTLYETGWSLKAKPKT
jgi:hypothetical protein